MVGGNGGVADALFTELDRSRFEDNFLDKKEELEGFAETGISCILVSCHINMYIKETTNLTLFRKYQANLQLKNLAF